MKNLVTRFMLVFVFIAGSIGMVKAQTGDLFFSEYIEGNSNNKAIEIYNPTANTILLADYQIAQSSNGGGWQYYHTFPAGAAIAPGDVWTILNSSTNPALFDALNADEVLSFPSVVHHNGDDARGLIKISGTDTLWLDIIGTPDFDPGSGWAVAGVASATANKTLVRKASITTGNTDWTLSAGTDANDSEWIVVDVDVFTYLGSHPHVIDNSFPIVFNVNMNYQITAGNFDPLTETVDVAGSFNAWAGTAMTDSDGDGIYTAEIAGFNAGDTALFKFRINSDWGNAEFPGGPNRQFVVESGMTEVSYWYNDNAGPQSVTFTIVDATESYLNIKMKGSYDGWVLHQMYDDGTNGDLVAGDHTWTCILEIQGGTWEWGAIEDDSTLGELWLLQGPNLVFTVNTDGTVSGDTSYEIPTQGNETIVFNVNMNQQIALGNFDPALHFVDVAGSFNNYSTSGAFEDLDGDGIYTKSIDGFTAGNMIEYKFRLNGDWNTAEFPGMGNRMYTVIGGGADVILHWYNDELPPAQPDLFFSEYIEGSSNNKALEIYNPTNDTILLDSYQIAQSSNGGGWQYYHTFPAGAAIAPGDVWTIITNQVNPTLFDALNADEVLAFPSVVHHNGDDARGLIKISGTDTLWLDIIGTPDVDPGTGWDVAGISAATANKTLVRKASVTIGNTDWAASAGTDENNSEWIVLDIDVFDYLGSHPHIIGATGTVVFHVNMSYQVSLGNFDPAIDFVDVAGSFNNWGGTTLSDVDGDLTYSVTIENIPADSIFFKFRINGDWNNAEFPNGGADRNAVVEMGTQELSYWYNDELPVAASDLFFSEYIEGSSNNKALEIYNPTNDTILLDSYQIAQSSNGGGWQYYHTFPAGAAIAPGDVWTIITNQVNPTLFDALNADEVLAFPSVVHHNGDDARGLIKISGTDTLWLDIIGTPDVDPGTGWDVAGISAATANKTLIRKASITAGNTDWAISAGTDATNSEWIVMDIDAFDYLGFHPHTIQTTGTVVFNVNMSYQVTLGNFDPATEFVDIAGTFDGFAGTMMTDTDGDLIYTVTIENIVPGDIFFKFRINGDWGNAEFPGGNDRQYTVSIGTQDLLYWYNDEQPVPNVSIYDIQFTTNTSGDSPYAGQIVSTTGLVTAANSNSYFIQDGVGAWSGLYVYSPGHTAQVGDSLFLTGLIEEYYGVTELLNVTTFTLINSGNTLPAPTLVTTGTVNSDEAYEAVLVQVENASCTVLPNNYGEWYISDGTGECQIDDLFFAYTPALGSTYNVVGVVHYSFGSFELLPRSADDIEDITVYEITQTLNLPFGWSLFSTYLIPAEANMDSVFGNYATSINLIKNGIGEIYWPFFGINTIIELAIGDGYQANMIAATTVDITGIQIVPEETPIELGLGWSLVAYLRDTPGDAELMFASLDGNLLIAKNGSGAVYWPSFALNSIGDLLPGQGYQVNLADIDTLIYPANTSAPTKYSAIPTSSFINTGSNLTLGIPAEAWNQIPAMNSEILVYNSNGQLVGKSLYQGGFTAIAIWGDDALTNQVDGLQENEAFQLALRQNGNEQAIRILQWTQGNGQYKTDDIQIAGELSIENAFMVSKLWPNPATSTANLEVITSTEANVSIRVFNLLGKMVLELNPGTLHAGEYQFQLPVSKLTPGAYLYQVIQGTDIQQGKFEVIR